MSNIFTFVNMSLNSFKLRSAKRLFSTSVKNLNKPSTSNRGLHKIGDDVKLNFNNSELLRKSSAPVIINNRNYADASGSISCKIAIVTGGAKGIGLGIVKTLLEAKAKAVIIADVDEKAAEKACCHLNCEYGKNTVFFQPCDVTKKEQFEKVFKCTKSKFEKVDILVNNAGINQDANWESEICTNVNGIVRGTLLAMEAMGKCGGGKGGHVINVSSVWGLEAVKCCPIYSGTGYFAVGFTKAMGTDFYFKKTGVKVMALCPGATDTELVACASKFGLKEVDGVGAEIDKHFKGLELQDPQCAANCVVNMFKDDENGSIWVVEDSECFKAKMPSKASMKPPGGCKKEEKKKAC